jgi:hypothetical protein
MNAQHHMRLPLKEKEFFVLIIQGAKHEASPLTTCVYLHVAKLELLATSHDTRFMT